MASGTGLRIIGGTWKGRRLVAPPGLETRPLPDRVKQALFDWLGQRLDGLAVVDCCAGSGAFACEALSRGAARVDVIEPGTHALPALRANAAALGNPPGLVLHPHPFERVLPRLHDVDLVFADPPFAWFRTEPKRIADLVRRAAACLAPEGRLVIRGERGVDLPALPDGIVERERRTYGRSWLAMLVRAAVAGPSKPAVLGEPRMSAPVRKIVLAYSGGLDTSVILRWLVDRYGAEVVAFCADLGQAEELDGLDAKARATGASKCVVDDLREEFVRDFVFPMFRAGAIYESQYLLGTSIARPLIAKRQVEIARQEGADAVAHGATGKGNDQVRFELTFAALAPELAVIAPWREWTFKGRADLIAYAEEKRIPITVTAEKPYSSDRNLLHVSYEGGILEDPWRGPYDDMFQLTVAPEAAPDQPEEIEVDLEGGVPVAVNGERLGPAALLDRLNTIGGRHGIGRVDVVENRYVGLKSRGVYETPGGTLLRMAFHAVESLTMDREVMHLRDALVPRYAEMVYYGYWFAPEREMLQTAIDEASRATTGTARLKLYKGSVRTVGRKAPRSLYDPKLVSFDEAGGYRQEDAGGFIRLAGLRLRIRALVERAAR